MLKSRPVIAFIASKNPERARPFYENTLGLRFVSSDAFAHVFKASGNIMLRVVKTPGFKPTAHTVLGWEVSDIRAAVAGLMTRKVKPVMYPELEQDEYGIWKAPGGSRVVWFKDPDGNILSLTQL
jgi:catechol 2,3-dioxygenase-like lactoylglutathione lyase family enzyme